ncbi:MAG: metallophosphoesterase [Marinifilaceae bacterium]|nr:metallophosphoesterase [Marinifilaceae bacterium]
MRNSPPPNILGAVIMGVAFAALIGCEMIESHPYDTKISGECDLIEKSVQRVEQQLKDSSEITFAVISDTQRWYDETEDCVNAINERGDIDFVLHCGDFADFGLTKEFVLMRDLLSKLDVPYLTAIGNHDCLATGDDVYKKVYGPTNYAFTAGNVRIISLNTNALEYDYSEKVPDFSFMGNELYNVDDAVEKSIVLMHAPPYSDVFNNNVNEIFHHIVSELRGIQFCLHGHTHSLGVEDIFGDGILYYECPCIEKRKYLLFTIHNEGYDYEVVDF